MKINGDFVILGGRKYYRTTAPILTEKRWNDIEQVVKQSIIDDAELEFVLCVGSYEEVIRGKPFLFNESLRSFLVNHRVIMGKEIVAVNYLDESDRILKEMEAQHYDFF
ncbi:hypothetical protein HCI99_04335 [Listeria booriae]|uniref:Uncharacterized protein n=1 Tax=Listeria booriae TaxID=1552123 RepID=A0A7X0XBA2_9LIST|nr:hypothetical protein [Listeria booriae]MBC1491040.1 hypothetical protein [Listeria booriae]MBC1491045.1 hypothetical protein [Listeria booriae]MBC6151123.1 hypothetical protein [Listeria booriae]MBC6151128.1 hypothetical protein [Listeria booriae]